MLRTKGRSAFYAHKIRFAKYLSEVKSKQSYKLEKLKGDTPLIKDPA